MATSTLQALCCHCGTLRTFASTYYGRRLADADTYETNGSVLHLRDMQARGHCTEVELYWRVLIGLKCRTCGAWTRHAALRTDDARADWQEERQLESDERLAKVRCELRAHGTLERRTFDSPRRVLALTHFTSTDTWTVLVRAGLSADHEHTVLTWAIAAIAGELEAHGFQWSQRHPGARTLTLEADDNLHEEIRARAELVASVNRACRLPSVGPSA